MINDPNKKVCYVTWSGGIDSTGVLGLLLQAGWAVHPITLLFGGNAYRQRERTARKALTEKFSKKYPSLWNDPVEVAGHWLNHFKVPDGEMPRRNKHILDWMMVNYVIPNNGYYIGMGEYIGADTWAVKDHVGAHDADTRYLAAYLLHEYGLNYRLMTLADFGESRYKSDRVRLLVEAVGPETALMTTNCLMDKIFHCGECYKCIERHAAFRIVLGSAGDTTGYIEEPSAQHYYPQYHRQMQGSAVNINWKDIKLDET